MRYLAANAGMSLVGTNAKSRNVSFRAAVGVGADVTQTSIEDLLPSRPGELHPEPLTEPDLTLSRHPARATARRLPPSIGHRVPPVAG
jgi:hypothetical protein